MEQTADRCPKCGQPRWAEATECPYCGVVYARAYGRATGAQPVVQVPAAPALAGSALPELGALPALPELPDLPPIPEPDHAPPHEDVYQGPTLEEIMAAKASQGASRPPAAGTPRVGVGGGGASGTKTVGGFRAMRGVEERETLVTRYLDLSLVIAVFSLILLNVVLNGQVFGSNTDVEKVSARFFALTSLDAPEDLAEAQDLAIAGHHVLMFSGDSGDVVLAYQSPRGGEEDTDELLLLAEERFEALGSPSYGLSERPVEVSLSRYPARRVNLGTPDQPAGQLVSFVVPGNNGRPVLVVVVGRPAAVMRRLAGWS